MKLQIRLIEVDDLNEENKYYLYCVEGDNFRYYVSRSDEELAEEDVDTWNYSNEFYMRKREEFTDREWEIAKYLFLFLWDSSNGTNTCVEPDIYEDDGFTKDEIEDFINKFQFDDAGVLEMYEEGGVEIYWAYFSCFDMLSCDFWEDCK